MADTSHMRVLRPRPHILAFYDGRIAGQRFAEGPNWVDDGALSLGIASYAVISENEALIYDTHISVAHARFIRTTLEKMGIDTFTVVLSHWHLDHVAGTEVFADSTIIANKRTRDLLQHHKAAIEDGTHHGLPAINPLILPTHVFERGVHIHVGRLHIDLIQCNIHSDDATVVHLKADGVLLAGDTLEDTVTYVGEPENFATHLVDLDRLVALNANTILPNHGDPDVISSGGYGPGLITATQDYLWKLMAARGDPALRSAPLADWVGKHVVNGHLTYFAPYEGVHAQNLRQSLSAQD